MRPSTVSFTEQGDTVEAIKRQAEATLRRLGASDPETFSLDIRELVRTDEGVALWEADVTAEV
jgi:hypothetical protein